MIQARNQRRGEEDLWRWDSWAGKVFIYVGTLCFGSCYPIVVAWSKQGQERYPYMYPTSLLLTKCFMFIFYAINLWWERSSSTYDYSEVRTQENVPVKPRPDAWGKFKLSLWALPNIVLTLLCDVITFQSMQYVSVASYTLIVQTTTLWIVAAQFVFLKKVISCPQALAVTLVTLGVVGFQSLDLQDSEVKDVDATTSYYEFLGVGLVAFRGFLKACNMVYCEWFLQTGLQELTFYEKQCAIAFWFVVSSIGLVLQSNGAEIIGGRSFFDGYAISTWAYIILATGVGIWYYLLVKHLDALMMGICMMCTLPCTVVLDMFLFGTELTLPQMIFAGVICFGSFQYNLLKKYILADSK